jgi:hypothetical protein
VSCVPEPQFYCLANRCRRKVTPGRCFCHPHLGLLKPGQAAALGRIDPRGLWSAAINLDTLDRLETIAAAIEDLALKEGANLYCWHRVRADRIRQHLASEAPADEPPAAPSVQATLFPADRSRGPYGPGRDR